jgi:hypothetical protein
MSEMDRENKNRKLQREADLTRGYDPDAMEAAREAWDKAEAAAKHAFKTYTALGEKAYDKAMDASFGEDEEAAQAAMYKAMEAGKKAYSEIIQAANNEYTAAIAAAKLKETA